MKEKKAAKRTDVPAATPKNTTPLPEEYKPTDEQSVRDALFAPQTREVKATFRQNPKALRR